jgi:DNA-binding XRE family transcriptional regulator
MTTKKQLIKLINRQASKRGLNPTRVARQGGISQPTWWAIRNGEQNAKWDTLIKVASSLDITVTITAAIDD